MTLDSRAYAGDRATVCDACGRASCWHMLMPCEDHRTAGTKRVAVESLSKGEQDVVRHYESDS